MKNNIKYRLIKMGMVVACALIFMGNSISVLADEQSISDIMQPVVSDAYTEIDSAEGLLGIAENPEGCYRLVNDIDMSGIDWVPFAFHGMLDGGGYSILNLTVRNVGDYVKETYDGNMKVYDTSFAGLFDAMIGATVTNLHLLNLRIDVETDLPCFVGGFAGYMEESVISDADVQGILFLRAHDRMFGVGGIIGYGCGDIQNVNADVTLICIDTDASTRDEQFMGGVCAAGYPNMKGCDINIAGFDSDHGYVHDGGLVGMYMFYPKGMKYYGTITDNMVAGKITFFEDNTNRRAYCTGFIGEIMNWDFENGRNKADFVRDERYDYTVDLLPHSCDNPVLSQTITEPMCDSFGYTEVTCETCGYTEKDSFTLKSHTLKWEVVTEAAVLQAGVEEGKCEYCDYSEQREIPALDPTPEPTAAPTPVPEAELEPQPATKQNNKALYVGIALAITAGACGIIQMIVHGGRKRRK